MNSYVKYCCNAFVLVLFTLWHISHAVYVYEDVVITTDTWSTEHAVSNTIFPSSVCPNYCRDVPTYLRTKHTSDIKVDVVEEHKYLGAKIGNILRWDRHWSVT